MGQGDIPYFDQAAMRALKRDHDRLKHIVGELQRQYQPTSRPNPPIPFLFGTAEDQILSTDDGTVNVERVTNEEEVTSDRTETAYDLFKTGALSGEKLGLLRHAQSGRLYYFGGAKGYVVQPISSISAASLNGANPGIGTAYVLKRAPTDTPYLTPLIYVRDSAGERLVVTLHNLCDSAIYGSDVNIEALQTPTQLLFASQDSNGDLYVTELCCCSLPTTGTGSGTGSGTGTETSNPCEVCSEETPELLYLTIPAGHWSGTDCTDAEGELVLTRLPESPCRWEYVFPEDSNWWFVEVGIGFTGQFGNVGIGAFVLVYLYSKGGRAYRWVYYPCGDRATDCDFDCDLFCQEIEFVITDSSPATCNWTTPYASVILSATPGCEGGTGTSPDTGTGSGDEIDGGSSSWEWVEGSGTGGGEWILTDDGCTGAYEPCPPPNPGTFDGETTTVDCAAPEDCNEGEGDCPGECHWQWTEFGWNGIVDICAGACSCDEPAFDGTDIGEEAFTPCYNPSSGHPSGCMGYACAWIGEMDGSWTRVDNQALICVTPCFCSAPTRVASFGELQTTPCYGHA